MHDDRGHHQNPSSDCRGQLGEALDRLRGLVVDGLKHGFFDYSDDPFLEALFQLPPGYEKSRTATEIATRLWTERGEPTLYLMLTRDAILERLGFIGEDGARKHWSDYQGHTKKCRIYQWAKHGYSGAKCSCGHEGELAADQIWDDVALDGAVVDCPGD